MTERIEVQINADASGLIQEANRAGGALADFGRITDRMAGIASGFTAQFAPLTSAFIAAESAVRGVSAAFSVAQEAFRAMNAEVADAERVAAKLTATFDGADASMGRLVAQANQLATQTVFFDDDAIKGAAAVLRSFELTEAEISKLLPAAVNLATVFDKDLGATAEALARGLAGTTKGLLEYGIRVQEGTDRSQILATVLERGAREAKGAAQAQEGLRGKTAALAKAQGEFNQAMGELLRGPNESFLQFLTDAANKAATLANKMSGAADAAANVTRTVNVATGKVTEAGPLGAVTGVPSSISPTLKRQLEDRGILPVDPAEKKRREAERAEAEKRAREAREKAQDKARQDAERAQRRRDAQASKREREADAGASARERTRQQQQKELEDAVRADAQMLRDQKRTAADIADSRRRLEDELAQRQLDGMTQAAQQAADIFAEGVRAAGAFFADVIAGKATLGGGIRAFSGVASALGFAAGGPIGGAVASVGTELAAVVADAITKRDAEAMATREGLVSRADLLRRKIDRPGTMGSDLEKHLQQSLRDVEAKIAELDKQAADAQTKAAELQKQAAEAQAKAAEEQRMAAKERVYADKTNQRMTVEAIQLAYKSQQERTAARFAELGMPGAGMHATSIEIPGAQEILRNMSGEQLAQLGQAAREAIRTGDTSVIQKAFPMLGNADNLLQTMIAALAEVTGVAGEPDAALGNTPRNPMYVYDVTPSRDEFTQAPRGLFFRPVGVDRGVSGGQSLSGVTSGGTNRSASGTAMKAS